MRFVHNQPVLFIDEISTLVIADLHIGLETELAKSGINISSQIKKIKEDIDYLLNITKASILVVIGDIKHTVPGVSWQEIKDIPELFEYLSSKVKVIICKGNHDDHIEKIIKKEVKIHDSRGFKIGRFGFLHGHAWPSENLLNCEYIIISHIHPAVEFKDKLGYRIVKPAWIKSNIVKQKILEKYKKEIKNDLGVVIIPSFNRLISGSPINTGNKLKDNTELLGPLMKNGFIDLKKAEIYLLDGTYLGKISDL